MFSTLALAGLAAIMALTLLLPFSVRWIEEELELFLLVMGVLAVSVAGLWSAELVREALREPLKITAAVLVFGFAFRRWRADIGRGVRRLAERAGLPAMLFATVLVLGLAASVVTAIVAALVLVEALESLRLPPEAERQAAILGCFAIGLGAALTPLGEPLSTIATARLAGPPHDAGFLFLARLMGAWIAPVLLLLAALAARLGRRHASRPVRHEDETAETAWTAAARGFKVYVFVAALVLLGRGLSPLVETRLAGLQPAALYWANTASAALDNATLAAAEISPKMDAARIRAALLGLLISGGMLIPGNIPNIVAAGKLGIKSRDWARIAVPLGLALMAATFVALELAAAR